MEELLFAEVCEKCLERAVRRAPVGVAVGGKDLNESRVRFGILILWPAVWMYLPGEWVVLRNGVGVSWDDRFMSQFLKSGMEMTCGGREIMGLRRNRPRRVRWKRKEGGWRGKRQDTAETRRPWLISKRRARDFSGTQVYMPLSAPSAAVQVIQTTNSYRVLPNCDWNGLKARELSLVNSYTGSIPVSLVILIEAL